MIWFIIIYAYIFLLWIVQSAFTGVDNAFFVCAKNFTMPIVNKTKVFGDRHKSWTWNRVIDGAVLICGVLGMAVLFENSFWKIIQLLMSTSIAMIFSFSFWHNGYLYITVNRLYRNIDGTSPPYPHGFTSSPDGAARFDFTWGQRLIMFCLSIATIVTALLLFFYGKEWQSRNVSLLYVGIGIVGVIVYRIRHGKVKN